MRKILLNILLLTAALPILAQVDSIAPDKTYIKHYWKDFGGLVVSPIEWKGSDWCKMAVFAGATAGLFLVDEPVRNFFQDHRTHNLDRLTHDFISPAGSTWSGVFSAGWYGLGQITNKPVMQATGLMAVQAFVTGSVLVRIPKAVFGRVRPDAWWGPSPFDWRGPLGGSSFPSGHTTAAFSVASVFAYQYRDTKWVPVLAYSLAGMVGAARIYEDRHWISDVFAGAALGIVTGRFICKSYNQHRYALVPFYDSKAGGISLVMKL